MNKLKKMKQLKMALAAVLLTASSGLISCNDTSENKSTNTDETKHEMVEVKAEKEKVDTEKDYVAFKLETDRIVAKNEAKMLELKIKMMTMKADTRTQFQKDLDAVNVENEKLKANIKTFKNGTEDNLEDFKKTINKDIDQLGKSISALADHTEKKN